MGRGFIRSQIQRSHTLPEPEKVVQNVKHSALSAETRSERRFLHTSPRKVEKIDAASFRSDDKHCAEISGPLAFDTSGAAARLYYVRVRHVQVRHFSLLFVYVVNLGTPLR